MRINALLAALLVTWTTVSVLPDGAAAGEPNRLSKSEKSAGWQLLFDGKTTQGWRGYRKETAPKAWKAVDGTLTFSGRGGDLITKKQFDNYELRFEWKISPAGNSGVIYRVAEDQSHSFMTGPEYQILDNKGHANGKDPKTSAASNYGLYAPNKDVTKPVGQWNQARLILAENHVEHWLNGVRVVAYDLKSDDWNERVSSTKFRSWPRYGQVSKGHIALQDHGNQVWYRNLKIRPLGQK